MVSATARTGWRIGVRLKIAGERYVALRSLCRVIGGKPCLGMCPRFASDYTGVCTCCLRVITDLGYMPVGIAKWSARRARLLFKGDQSKHDQSIAE